LESQPSSRTEGKPAVRNDRGSRKRRHHSKPDLRLDPSDAKLADHENAIITCVVTVMGEATHLIVVACRGNTGNLPGVLGCSTCIALQRYWSSSRADRPERFPNCSLLAHRRLHDRRVRLFAKPLALCRWPGSRLSDQSIIGAYCGAGRDCHEPDRQKKNESTNGLWSPLIALNRLNRKVQPKRMSIRECNSPSSSQFIEAPNAWPSLPIESRRRSVAPS
jgi:hypothetical protein